MGQSFVLILCSLPWTMLLVQYPDGETMSFMAWFNYHGNSPCMSHVMWQISDALHGNCSRGDGERKQTNNPFVACVIITHLFWSGFITVLRSLLVSSVQNSNINPQPLKIHKAKTLFFREASFRSMDTCLLCWTGRHQTQNKSTDHWMWSGNEQGPVQQWPLNPNQPRPTLNSFHHRREGSSNNAVHFEASSWIFLPPTHWNKSAELLVFIRTLQDTPETHFWFVLHTFPLKLRWLIISKYSTDLRVFSYIYMHQYLFHFYSFICFRDKSWDKRKGKDYLKAVRCNYIHEPAYCNVSVKNLFNTLRMLRMCWVTNDH